MPLKEIRGVYVWDIITNVTETIGQCPWLILFNDSSQSITLIRRPKTKTINHETFCKK